MTKQWVKKEKNTEATETGEKDGDIRNTSTMDNTGATEDDSTSTAGDNGVGNKNNGFILVEEGKEIGEGKNKEAAVEQEENKKLSDTVVTGGTKEESKNNNDTKEDGIGNEDDSTSLEEWKTMEEGEKEME